METKQTKYSTYKRGAIVLVDYKTGVGNELQGNHLSIVLTKKDSPNNGILTVIPLSSKNKPYYLDLGNLVQDIIIPDFERQTLSFLYSIIKDISSSGLTDSYEEEMKSLMAKMGSKIKFEDIQQSCQSDPVKNINEIYDFITNIKEFEKAFKTYQNMNTKSYALIQNISSISKLRIRRPINKYDPNRRIRVPDSIMDSIDNEIIKHFTKQV